MCMCVRVCECMCVYMHVCVVGVYVHMYKCTCMHACVYACMWIVCVHVCECTCVFMHVCAMCMCTYMRVHVHVLCMCMCVCALCVYMWVHVHVCMCMCIVLCMCACAWIYVHCVYVPHLVITPVLWRPCSVKSPFLYKDLAQWGPHFVKTLLYVAHTMKAPLHEGPPVKTTLCEDPALWRFCSAFWPHSCLCLHVERMKTKLGLGDPIFTHSLTVTGSTTVVSQFLAERQ